MTMWVYTCDHNWSNRLHFCFFFLQNIDCLLSTVYCILYIIFFLRYAVNCIIIRVHNSQYLCTVYHKMFFVYCTLENISYSKYAIHSSHRGTKRPWEKERRGGKLWGKSHDAAWRGRTRLRWRADTCTDAHWSIRSPARARLRPWLARAEPQLRNALKRNERGTRGRGNGHSKLRWSEFWRGRESGGNREDKHCHVKKRLLR